MTRRDDEKEKKWAEGRTVFDSKKTAVPYFAYFVHVCLAVDPEEVPASGHPHEIRSYSRPRLVVETLVMRERILDTEERGGGMR